MFDAYCSTCSRRQLVFPTQVLGIVNDAAGIHVFFRCSRGHVEQWLTGRTESATAA